MKNIIIGIKGKNGIGKDTVANIILYILWKATFKYHINYMREDLVHYNDNYKYKAYDWKHKKFAGKVNKYFKKITGIDFSNLERDEKEKVRPTFIKFAEEMKNIFGKNIWIKKLFKNKRKNNWIISDVRFTNEENIIKANNGFIINIVKKETTSKKLEYTVINNKTIGDLVKKIEEILKHEKII